MTRVAAANVALAMLLLAGCGLRAPHTTPAPRAPVARDGALDAFALTEVTDHDTAYALPARHRSVYDIDVNSTVRVEVDADRLARQVAPSADRERDDRLARDRATLTWLLTSIADYLVMVRRVEETYLATHDASGRRTVDGTGLASYHAARAERRESGLDIQRAVGTYIADREGIITQDPLRDLRVDSILEAKGIDVTDYGGAFPAFVRSELARVQGETQRLVDGMAAGARRTHVRMWARLIRRNGEVVPVHLPGYDSLVAGVPVVVNRLSFALDEEDTAELGRVVDANAELATAFNQLQREANRSGGIVRTLMDEATALFDAGARQELQRILVARADEVEDSLAAWGEDVADRLAPEQRQALEDLRTTLVRIRTDGDSLVRRLEALPRIDALRNAPASAILVGLTHERLGEALGRLRGIRDLISPDSGPSLADRIDEVGELVTELAPSGDRVLGDPILDLPRRLLTGFAAEAMAVWERRAPHLFRLANAANALRRPNLTALAADVGRRDTALDIPFTQLRDTEIPILRTSRKEGDLVELGIEVRTPEGRLIAEDTRLLRVQRFGAHSAVNGILVFARPFDDEAGTRFTAAPAISYEARYRRRTDGLWNLIDPGAALTVALLDFEEADVEFGLGVAGSLFSGILEAGAGYNFDADAAYYFVGVGLAGAFDKLSGR